MGVRAYSDALSVYSLCSRSMWLTFNKPCTGGFLVIKKESIFGKQAIAMTWDFPEANAIINETVGGFGPAIDLLKDKLANYTKKEGECGAKDTNNKRISSGKVVSTDPPYYDNIGYADLSDFFYVWLRHSLRTFFPELFATLAVPKAEELVASPYRHGSKREAEKFFPRGHDSGDASPR